MGILLLGRQVPEYIDKIKPNSQVYNVHTKNGMWSTQTEDVHTAVSPIEGTRDVTVSLSSETWVYPVTSLLLTFANCNPCN